MKKISKIITHAGAFHADEVLAVAILRQFGIAAPVERKFQVSSEELADPEVLVLDVAQHFEPTLGNFDHHHDRNLSATNVLIADWLVGEGEMSAEVRENLQDFLGYVSDVDRGVIPGGGIAASFNGIIRSLNPADLGQSTTAFEGAVNLAQQIIAAQFAVAERAVADAHIWAGLERMADGKVAVQLDTYQLAGWKEIAEKEGVEYLVTPNPRGGWQIISRDSIVFNIPVDGRQSFRHNSGFLAVYSSKEDALAHATEIAG